MGAGGKARPADSLPRPTLLLVAAGLALFLSSMWTARADASGVPTAVVYLTRVVSFTTYMVMAWSFRSHVPPSRAVAGIGCALMLAHLGAEALAAAPLGADVELVLRSFSGIFEGVANALLTLVFAQAFSTFRPRESAMGVGVAYLLVDACILALDTLGPGVLNAVRAALKLAAVGIAAWCGWRLIGAGEAAAGADEEDEHPLAFLASHVDWLLLLIVAFLFPSLFGVIAQVSSVTGGNFALYDIPTEVAMVAMEALFLLFLGAYGTRFGFSTILAFVIPLFATGFALFPGDWASGSPLAGCLVRAGYVVLAILIWALMARMSYRDPRHTYLYFGVYCGISNAQAGRMAGSLLMGDAGPSLELCQGISLAALWAICMFGLVMFLLLRRDEPMEGQGFPAAEDEGAAAGRARAGQDLPGAGRSAGEAGPGGEAGEGGATGGTAIPGQGGGGAAGPDVSGPRPGPDLFAARFEAFASRVRLTKRERQVLLEALHGYSRANIAKKLYLSPETVKTYLNRAYAKAQVTSKQELVAVIESEPVSGGARR